MTINSNEQAQGTKEQGALGPFLNDMKDLMEKKGFTLVELMVVLLITSIAVVAIYRGYHATTANFEIQEQLNELHQSLRFGLEKTAREIRMAGYDPTGSSGAGFVYTAAEAVRFTKDLNGNGVVTDTGEDVIFSLIGSSFTLNGTVEMDTVDALDFVYLDDSGNAMATPVPADVRAVQVSLVVRTVREDYALVNTASYRNLQGTEIFTAPGDHFRRRVMTVLVRCYNLEL